jgi:uncharacterized protein
MAGLPITSIIAAVAAIALVALSLPVTIRRFQVKSAAGDAGDEVLRRRIRAQGNYIEYVPPALIVLALAELSGAASWLIWSLGLALLAGRLLHALGMLNHSTPLRGAGMILTYVALIGGAVRLIIASLG